MKKIFGKEFIIGLSVIIAMLILFFGIDYLKGINLFKPSNFYVANYSNVAGLDISAPVTIDGYKVGQVREINFNYENPGKIEVVLALNKSLRLPEDSKAIISTTLLNGAYVEIQVGKSSNMLAVGGELSTEVKGDMMASITDGLMPKVESILPRVDSLLLSVNTLVSDPALLKTVRNLELLSENLNATSMSLKSMMSRQVPSLLSDASNVTKGVNDIITDLSGLTEELSKLQVAKTFANIEEVTTNLSTFSTRLNDKNSTLGLLMNDPELYNNLTKVTSDVDSLIVDIKKNPKRYISIKLL